MEPSEARDTAVSRDERRSGYHSAGRGFDVTAPNVNVENGGASGMVGSLMYGTERWAKMQKRAQRLESITTVARYVATVTVLAVLVLVGTAAIVGLLALIKFLFGLI